MHFKDGEIPVDYQRYIGRKITLLVAIGVTLCATLVVSLSLGAASIPIQESLRSLLGMEVPKRTDMIVWHIRLPQALAAMVAGAALSVAGVAMQSILRNPLGSPFTLGISHAAAFGAALSVMLLGRSTLPPDSLNMAATISPYLTTGMAFLFSVASAVVITAVSRMRGASSEVMVLTGVALGALFTAGTMFLQYFADDVQLAAMVFWSFGDTARATWSELAIITVVLVPIVVYFLLSAWSLNAIEVGDETAAGLGVRVGRVRLVGMLLASLLTAVVIAFLGIIGFVGLVVPHLFRRLLGSDHRFLTPACLLGGALLLLASDTAARQIFSPHALPVSILTAFMGAPMLICLMLRRPRP